MSNSNDRTYYFDQEEVNCHIKIMKWTGVIGIILVSLSTPLYILASMEWMNNNPFDYVMEVNQTAPGRVAQSVTCLTTDASLTADPGVASSIPARSWSWRLIMK